MFYDETGGMQYDPNRINALIKDGVKRGFWGYDYRSLQKDPNWAPDESQAVTVPCRAGEFVIFWSTLMHASLPHAGLTKESRIGFASRYIPSSVRIYPDTEFLAAGRPGDHLVAEGIELHRSSRTAVYRIDARAQDGRLVATALARVFRTDRPWDDA